MQAPRAYAAPQKPSAKTPTAGRGRPFKDLSSGQAKVRFQQNPSFPRNFVAHTLHCRGHQCRADIFCAMERKLFARLVQAHHYRERKEQQMPLIPYFACIGSLLLALLFMADWCFPAPLPPTERTEVDKTPIRIRSVHRWPERIDIDTRLPTIVPQAVPVVYTRPIPQAPRESFAKALPADLAAVPKRSKRSRPSISNEIAATTYQPAPAQQRFQAGW
jgi:hypothetical protein